MLRLTAAALAVLLCISMLGAHAEVLEIYGSTTVQKEIVDPLAASFRRASGIEIKTYGIGSGEGLVALLQGKTKVAMVSEFLEDALETAKLVAKKDGVPYRVPAGLTLTELRRDRLVVIVNAGNPMVELTRSQIRDIFTGRIVNWQDVGGDDMPIYPVMSAPGNGARAVAGRKIMDGAEYGARVAEVPLPDDALPIVSNVKGAIAVVSLLSWGMNPGATRFIAAPELDYPLGLVSIGKPGASVQRLIDFARVNARH